MQELKQLLTGRKFTRTSPITGVEVEGWVKDINYVIELSGKKNIRVSFYILSENGISYDVDQCSIEGPDLISMVGKISADVILRFPATL